MSHRHRHRYLDGTPCSCGRVKDVEAAKRGRRNLGRGKAAERAAVKVLGAKRVGQHGGPRDGISPRWTIQSKSRGKFPGWMADELDYLLTEPMEGGLKQWPVLIITEAPGAGKRARKLAVVYLDTLAEINELLGPEPDNSPPSKE
jgi:hypothetical protein